MKITGLLFLVSAVTSLPFSQQPVKETGEVTDKVEQLEQKIEELLDHSDMTPEELVDLLNDDIDSEEVEYIVEAVDEGLVVSLQGKQTLFYPDLDYTEESSEQNLEEIEEEKVEELDEADDEVGEGEALGEKSDDHVVAEEEEVVEYDYTLIETSGVDVVWDAGPAAELDYLVEETRSEVEEELDAMVELDEAVKYDHFYGDRKIFEIVIMSGIAVTCLMFIFGLAALISSFLGPSRSSTVTIAPLPRPPQMSTSSGGIIRQYTRVPVEIRNMLPSNVAYKQLYET